MNHQLTFLICDECWKILLSGEPKPIATIRTSHRSSFYCEHADMPADWKRGHQKPILVQIGNIPILVQIGNIC